MQLTVLLGARDENIRDHLSKSLGNKYARHDIQNELLEIMAHHVLMKKVEKIRGNVFFSIMGNEYTAISNKEQLSLCLRSVKENLKVQEDFLGFYQFTNIKSETTVHSVKDALLRFNLQLKNCRGKYKVLGDTMVTGSERCALVKPSPKRDNLFGTVGEQVEGKFDDENNTNQFSSLDKLSVTR